MFRRVSVALQSRRTWRHHGAALEWNPTQYEPEQKYLEAQWRNQQRGKVEHHDMGEWTRNNQMLYPPREEGEPRRPFEIYWGKAQVAAGNHGRPLERICFSINNMNVEEALAVTYNMKGTARIESLNVYETLREALDYAANDVEFVNNMHVAECFSVRYDVQLMPYGPVLYKQYYCNIYLMLREGPAPEPRKPLTTEDACDYYLKLHREKSVPLLW